ncbi:hypothetical protein [Corynebacterium sp. HMSC28B08]|uniref:hypothetical protein n=1 Tax=Corynebacterium sp. HMSC28B08 TaxID=1581066 RepID=UPI000A402F44|nr:hypothetical protein [Corynebacterium sp. HMSC28B08]
MSDMDEPASAVDRADQGFLRAFPRVRIRPAMSTVSALSDSVWREQLCNTAARLYDGPAVTTSQTLLRELVLSALADLSRELRLPRQGVPEFSPAGFALLTAMSAKLEALGVTPEHIQGANRATTTALKQLHPDREAQLIMATEWAFHMLQNSPQS